MLLLADRRTESPNSAKAAFGELLIVPLQGEVRRVELGAEVLGACFGPTTEWVAVACGEHGLYRVHVPTQRLEKVADHADTVWWPR